MTREPRFIVLKITDIERYCSGAEVEALQDILKTIVEGRANEGKEPLQCVCVENDWPEYETVWKMIEARVDGKVLSATAELFPMQGGPAIPMSLAKVIYAGYATLFGTRQSMHTIGSRGGFGWGEVEAIYKDPRGKAAMELAQSKEGTI